MQVGMATVNIGVTVSLAQHVGVTYAPAIIAVSDGHLNYFTGTFVVSEIKKFLRSVLPSVTEVSAYTSHRYIYDLINITACRYFNISTIYF